MENVFGFFLKKQKVAKKADEPIPPVSEASLADQTFEQRLRASEADLRRELLAVPELRLLSDRDVDNLRAGETASRKAIKETSRGSSVPPYLDRELEMMGYDCSRGVHEAMQRAAIKAGLALQSGPNCQLNPATAADMAKLSKELRDMGFVSSPGTSARQETRQFEAWCDQRHLEQLNGTVPTLTQMLQVEDEAKRLLLVRELARMPGSSAGATAQLARRAIMDLSPAVRGAARAALKDRPWRQYAPALIQGLRYPWPPVADQAAVALRTLQPPETVVQLVDLLDLPSPSAPVRDASTNRSTVRELVRLNHLRNCLLCHAPSFDKNDSLVRGLVPTPGEALPVAAAYYEAEKGNFVRADTTYLRQDFSVTLPTENAAPWPREQRYDFMTRLRTLSPGEATALAVPSRDYPQRDAVLYALRGLTGKDGDRSSARWREILGIGKK
jgi:hypothetical protein